METTLLLTEPLKHSSLKMISNFSSNIWGDNVIKKFMMKQLDGAFSSISC